MLELDLTVAKLEKAKTKRSLARRSRRRRLLLESLEDRRLLAGDQPPNVLSVVRADSNPTNAAAVNYTVTFDEPVRFVDATDFQLISGGSVAGATLAQVIPQTASTFNSIYTVAVNSGSGTGTLKLNVIDDNSIRDQQNDRLGGNGAGNGDYTVGETYTIDKTVPTVASISLIGTPTASASTIEYNVTFSEAVTGVNTGDFQLITSGLTGSSINSVAGSGTSYVVQVAVGAGAGTIQLALVDDDSIIDVATNALGGAGTGSQVNGPTHIVESVPPTVTSIVAAQPNPTNAALVDFTVTFSEPVLNVGLNDFALTIGGGITGAMITNVAGTSDTFIVTVNTGSGDGTIRLGMFDPLTITDLGGNAMATSTTTSPVITIDKTMPTMSQSLLDQSPTNAASVRYQVTFSEPVTGLSTSNLQAYVLNLGTPNLSGLSITSITGSGSSYVVTIATGTGNGAIGLRIVNDGNFKDAAGNAPTVLGGSGSAYVIDRIAPIVESVVLENVSPTNSASLSFLVTLDEAVQVFQSSDVAVDQVGFPGAFVSSVQYVTGTQKRVIVTPGIGEGTLSIDILPQTSATDFAGNQLATPANNFDAYTVDTRKPSVSSISLVGPTATNASSIAFDVTFSESVSNVTAADFALATSGITGAAITGIVGGGTSYTVTVGTGTFNGTIRLNATNSGTLRDGLGNPLAANFTGAVATIDRSAPTVLSISSPTSTTNATNIDYTITFSEPVTGLTTGDLALVAGGAITSASIVSLQGSGTAYTVSVNTGNGDGTVGLNINASTAIVDAVGNQLATGLIGNVVSVDKSLPTITTFASATSLLTNLSNIHFDVIFSEPVLGLDIADLTLTTIGLTGASIEQISGNGTTYSIRVSTGTGDGNARLALATLPTITDTAGNALQAVSLQSELVTIDKTTPTSMTLSGVSPAGVTVTNATSIQYEVVFAEPVTGITSAAFYPHTNQTGNLTGLSVSSVSGSGTTYLVSINIGFGNRGPLLLGIDNSAGLIKDLAGNAIAYIQGTGFNYVIDRVAPEVEFIRRALTSPTASTTLAFDVLFNEAVTGVNASDFALNAAGVGGATINSVTGNGTSYTVTVTHSGGTGTVGLNLVDDNSIVDVAGNALGGATLGDGNFIGQSYVITSATITGTVFSDNDGDGIRDDSENGLAGVTVFVDLNHNGVRDAGEPTTTTLADNPATTEFNETGTYSFTGLAAATFDVAIEVTGNNKQSAPVAVSTADGRLTLTESLPLSHVSGVTRPRSITVSPDGNHAVAVWQFGEKVSSYARHPQDGRLTLVSTVASAAGTLYGASEVVFGPTGDFVYVSAAYDNAINVFAINSSGILTFVEAVNEASLGSNLLNYVSGMALTSDGSQLIATSQQAPYALTVFSVNPNTGKLTLSQTLKNGDPGVNGLFVPTPPIITPDGTLVIVPQSNGFATKFFNRDPATGVLTPGQPQINLGWSQNGVLTDDGRYLFLAVNDATIRTLERDSITGVVSQIASTPSGVAGTRLAISPDNSALYFSSFNNSLVRTFSIHPQTRSLTLQQTLVNLQDMLDLEGAVGISVSPDGENVYVTAETSNAIHSFKANQGVRAPVAQSVTTHLSATAIAEPFAIAVAAPEVVSLTTSSPAITSAATIDFTIVFSEAVTGVDVSDFSLYQSTLPGATVSSVTGGPTSYIVTVSAPAGEGDIRLQLNDNDSILDVDNVAIGGPGTGAVLARSSVIHKDSLSPTVTSIVPPPYVAATATSVDYFVAFSEPVTGVDISDFVSVDFGATTSSVTSVTGNGAAYRVTVSTSGVNGGVRLDLVDNNSIVDVANNSIAAGLQGAVYTVAAPRVSGSIWIDADGDGVRQSNEVGRENLIVYADANNNGVRDAGELFATTLADNPLTTEVNEAGQYLINGLAAETQYTIAIDVHTDWQQTSPLVYSNDDSTLTLEQVITAGVAPDRSLDNVNTITVSADGRQVYTLSLNYHQLTVWDRDVANQTLTKSQEIRTGIGGVPAILTPKGFELTPDQRFGYLISQANDSVVAFSRNVTTGQLSFLANYQNGVGGVAHLDSPRDVKVSADGKRLYVAAYESNALTTFTIHPQTGLLTPSQVFREGIGGVTALSGPSGITVTKDGTQIAVTTLQEATINVFDVAPGDGSLSLHNSLNLGSSVFSLVVSPDGRYVYAPEQYNANIRIYARDVVSGDWTFLSTKVSGASDIHSLGISPDGTSLYLADATGDQVIAFDRNNVTGLLTSVQTLADTAPHDFLDGATTIVVTPDGRDVLVGSHMDDSLALFARLSGNSMPATHSVTTTYMQTSGINFGLRNEELPIVDTITTTSPSPTNTASINFTVTFNEPVTGVDNSDFVVMPTSLVGAMVTNVTGGPTQYTVSVATGSGKGGLVLRLVDNDTIVDSLGDALGGIGNNGSYDAATVLVDKLAPNALSFVRLNPSPTLSTSVTYELLFDEPVTGVDLADFSVLSTGNASGIVTSVSGSGTTFTVTVTRGGGDGTISLHLVDNDSIIDAAGNPLGGAGVGTGNISGPAYTIGFPPTVVSITSSTASPSNASTVDYVVTFSETVTNVTVADFTLSHTGTLSGSTIASITGTGNSRTVSVTSGTGVGSLRLNVITGGTAVDLIGDALAAGFTTGPAISLDKAAPTATSIARLDASPTTSTALAFGITFTEAVTGVNVADFAIVTTGLAGATITNVTGSGASYVVNLARTGGEGTISLNLIDDDSIIDSVGNPLGGSTPGNGNFIGEAYEIVTTGSITGFIVADTDADGFTDASEVTGVVGSIVYVDLNVDGDRDAGEPFATVTNPAGQYTISGVIPGSYTVRVEPPIGWQLTNPAARAAASGTLTQSQLLKDNVGGNNSLDEVAGVTASPDGNFVYTAAYIDNAVTVFSRNPTTGALTNIQTIINGTGGVAGLIGAQSISITRDGKNLYVASAIDDALVMFARNESTGLLTYLGHLKQGIGGVDGLNEAVAVRESADGMNLYVAAVSSSSLAVFNRNPVTGLVTFAQKLTGATGGSFSVDLSPDQRHVYLSSGNSSAVNVYNRNLTTGQLTLTQTVTVATPGYSALSQPWGISVSPDGKNVYVATKLSQGVVVLNRNEVTGHVSFNEFVPDPYSFANPDPVAVLVSPDGHHVAVTFQTGGGMAIYSRNQTTGKLTLVEFYLDGVGGFNDLRGAWDVEFSNDGRSLYLVTAYEDAVYVFNRSVGEWVPSSVPTSVSIGQVTTLGIFGAVNLKPLVESITYLGSTPVTASTINFNVVFSEPVTGVDPSDFTFVGSFTGATATGISGSGDTYVLTVSLADGLQGTLSTRVSFNGSIIDNEGQPLVGDSGSVFDTIDVDRQSPTILSASRLDSNPTNKKSLQYQLVFSEPLSGLALSDFSVAASGVTGGTVASLTGSGNSYIVTMSYTSGEGSLALLLADNDSIVDNVGRPLNGVGTGSFALPNYTIQLGTIEGSIFSDLNSNGVKEVGESGIGGQTLFIDIDQDGVLDAGEPTAVTTSGSGAYTFTGLVDGNYRVRWLQQSPYIQTLPAGGGAHVVPLAVASGISIANFGVHEVLPGSINGRLWNDVDEDGDFDVTESGIVGLTVYVDLNENGAFDSGLEPNDVTDADDLGTTTVNETGQYSFAGLPPGNYSIRVTSNQWQFTNTAPWDSATSTTYTDTTNFSANNKSLRISPDGNFVYVFDHLSNRIVVLRLPTTSSGSLIQVQVLTGEFTGTSNAIGDIAFTPDGSAMYMIENQSNRLAVFSRNVVNGTLTRVQTLTPPGTFPYSIEVAPDGKHLYVGGGYIAPYTINPANGTLTALANSATAARVQDIVFSSDGTRVYAVDYGNSLMRVYSRNVSTGAITQIQQVSSPIAASLFSIWSAVISDDDQDLYVAAPLTDFVWHFSTLVDGTLAFTGVYTLDTDSIRDLPLDLELSPNGKTLLVALGMNNAIQVLNRDPTDGSLTKGPVIGTSDPSLTNIYENSSSLMDLTPDGSLLVRANARASDLQLYRASFEPLDKVVVGIVENQATVRNFSLMQAVPEIVSIVPSTLGPTNASSISVVVTFNESVTGVDASDFAVDLTGLTGISIQSVNGSGAVYNVTLDAVGAIGQGTAVLRVIDNDTIVDSVLLPLDGVGTTSNAGQSSTILWDLQAPVVTSIVTDSAGVTGTNNALFTVTFSESVSGVDASDFLVVMTGGVSGAVVQSVTPRTGGNIFDVVVASGTGDGTLGLNLIDNDSILDTVGLALGGIGSGNGNFTGNVAIVERNPLRNIVGTLYSDNDRDGQRDVGEPGISGLRVYVDTNNNSVWNSGEPSVFTDIDNPATTAVDESGAYRFDGLALGTYTIRVESGSAYFGSPVSFTSVTLSIVSPPDTNTLLGVEPNLSAIRGTVFSDLNANGVVDLGETGFVGVTVYRDLNNNGVLDAGEPSQLSRADDPTTTVINEAGTFDFGQLATGTNRVRVQVPANYVATSPTLFSGNVVTSIDTFNNVSFLLHENLTTVSGVLFNDVNSNGSQDAGEGPLSGLVVYVDSDRDGIRDTGEKFTTTAVDGSYTIPNVSPGNILVRVVTVGQTLVTSPTFQTERLFVSSSSTLREINPTTGIQISSFSISPVLTRGATSGGLAFNGTSVFMLDRADNRILVIDPSTGIVTSTLGPLPTATYGGLAYVNSLLYASDNTNGRILAINPATGVVVSTFNIATLNAGTPFYSGTINLLDGLGESADGTKLLAGTVTQQRLIINPTTGIVEGAYTDLINERDLGIAGGGGRIFVGRRDTSSVQVYNASGTLTSTLNSVSTPDDVAASVISLPGANLTVVLDQQVTGINFGIGSSVGNISGRQYQDVNQNGSFDSGDVPVSGVRVYVDANNNESFDGTEASALTAADGTYSITGVTPGSYAVRVVTPANFRPASSYPASNRLFGISLETGSNLVRLLEFNPITGATIRSNLTTIVGTSNSEIAYDGNRIFLVNSSATLANNNIYELAIDGTILDQQPLQAGTVVSDFGPVVIGGVIFTLRGTGSALSLHRYDTESKQFVYQRTVTYNWDPQSFQPGASTPFPVLAYVSGVSTDGQSIILGTSDDRILTIDPATGIANFAMTASSLLPVDYARDSVGGEMYVAQYVAQVGLIAVFNAAGTQVRTLGVNRLLHGLGAGLHRNTATAVTVTAGQTVSNIDHRLVSTRSTISGTIVADANANKVNDAGDSPLAGIAVYLDTNRNSVYDVGEPQVVTNSSGQYTFTDVVPGEYVVRQVPVSDQTSQAWTANYNRLFTRTLANGVATISEIDPMTGQILRQFPTPGTNAYQTGLALRGDILYVSQSSVLYALDANTGTIISVTPLPSGQLDGLAIVGDKAYVLQSTTNKILVVDLATKQLERTIDVQSTNPSTTWNLINGLGESADGTLLAARNNSDVSIIDPATGLLVYTIPSILAGAGLAGAGGETYDQGNYVNNVQVFTDVRDRNGLIRRSLPHGFGVTANGYAAANVQAAEHRVRVFGEQSIANLNFGNVANPTISGTQYVDVNQSGVFDAGDTPLAGVTVFADLDNDHFPDAHEPQSVSAVDGSYTLTNLPSTPVVVRTVAPLNYAPTGTYVSGNRLFGTYSITDATSPTGFRLGIREYDPVTGVVLGQTSTSIQYSFGNSVTYDSDSLIVVDTTRKLLIQLTTTGTLLAEVAIPGLQASDSIVGIVNVQDEIYVMTRTSSSIVHLHQYDSRARVFRDVRTVTQSSGPSLATANLAPTLGEAPDGRSILAVSAARSSILVIDPITATVVREVPVSNYSSLSSGMTSVDGKLLVSGTTNTLGVLDGEFKFVRNASTSFSSVPGLGGGTFNDFGKTALVAAGAQLTGFNHSYRSTLPRDGQLDRDFGIGGITTTEFFSNANSYDASEAVAIDSLGRTITVGTGGYIIRHNANGSLDTTFGVNGLAHFPGTAVDVAINSSNQIIVAGSVFTGNGFQFVLARYVSNGSLDLSFGNQGIQRTTFSTVRANASAMVLQSDGKIVVVGTGSDGAVTYRDILVARYLPNGHLDSTFSNDGMTTASINAYDYAADVAVRFGEIVVAGSTQVGTTYDMAIWLFDATGSLNTAFDGDGIKTIDFAGTDDEAFAVAVSTEGRITVAGYSKVGSYENTAIAQVEANGTLNTTFDTDGKVVTNVSSGNDRAEAIVFDPLGQIVVTGSAASTFGISNVSLLRLNSNGSLDTTMDGDGIVTTNHSGTGLSDNGRDLAIRTDGSIVVVGSSDISTSPTNYDTLLIQYTSTGALDTNFQSTGIVTTPIRVSTDEAYSVALQADGKLIAAGSSRNSSNLDFALARYDAYGRLDTSYGTGGKVTTAIGTGDDIARRVIIRSDGKAIAVGRTKVGSNWNVALAQYNVDGTLDTSFGTAGIVTTDLGSTEDDGIDVVLDANQRIVVVGQKIADGSDIVLARYLSNGSLDTSFGTTGLTTFSLGVSSEIAASVLVQGDGKILIGGYSNVSGNNDFVIARFLATGTLDSTFDSDGWASADFGATDDYLQSLTFTHNGKIAAAGTRDAAGNFDFVITQFNSDGTLDTSFGTGGFTTTEFLGGTDVIRRVRVADDGKLVAAGYSNDPVRATVDFALARYTAAGVLDATFEGNGKTTTSVGTLNNVGWDMVVDHNGEIVIAGSAISGGSTDFALARYAGPVTADLALDSSNNLLIRHSATSSNRTIRFEGTNVIVTDSLANMTTTIADATGSGSSTITLPLSSFTGSLVYRTNDGDQTLTLDLSLASLSRSLTILGEKGTDQLNVIGGSFANAYLQFSGADSGQITLDGNSFIQFDGLVAINTTTAFGSFTATYPDGSSALTLDSPLVNQVRLTHSSAPTLTLASPSQSLVVHAGSGDDTISLSGLPSDFAANLSIDGGAGTDIVTVTGPLSLVGGDLAIDADAIVANAAISTAGGDVGWTASGNVQLNSSLSTTGGNVNIHADSDADGDGLFQVRPTLTSQYSAPQFVTASDGAGGDWFGSSVAVQGDTAFIAADGDQNFGNDSGSVYVFTKSNGVWTETQKIVPSDGAANDYFGFPLAIDGDTAVISASRHEVAGATDAGAVYVYRKIAGVWAFEQKLTASDADANDWFGTSVAIEGDTIAVSSPQDDAAAIDAGAVYVFTRSGSTWTQQQKLVATSPLAYQKLGDSVALSNQTIVVGATQDSEGFSQAGSAFVFSRANGVWSQTQKLTSPTPSVYALFGSAVDVDNGTLVVTARFADNESILNAGAAFVYVNQNGTWVLQTKLSPEVAAAEGWFGWTASIVGDSLAIGALRGGNPIANHGAVYNYLRVGDSWYDQSKLVGDISGNGDSYGFAIHHDAQTLVVGAYRNDTPAVETGSAYFYELVNGTTPGGSIQTGGGNTVITTHSIELHGPITGTGTLAIRPSVASSSIGLGGAAGTLNLDDVEISQLVDGFSHITIGRPGSGSGTIMAHSATFTDPVTLAGGIIRESDATAITAPQLTLSGNLSPGQSPGITTFDSSVTISSGSTVTIEYEGTAGPGLPTGHDQVVASSNFHIEPNVTLALIPIGTPPFAGPLTIVKRTGGSGTFASIPEGHVFTNPFGNGQDFHLTYTGGDGDDIVFAGHSAPTDITLSSSSINENASTSSADLLFATLGASDADASETHVYSLAGGTGDLDNNSFRIVGNQLFVKQGTVLDFETKQNYLVRLRVTDSTGLAVEKEVNLQVNNLIEIQKSNVKINDGSVQRSRVDSVTIQFDTDVILQEGAITVHKRGAEGGLAGTVISPVVGVSSRTFTLSFAGAFTEFGSLIDGNYELRIDATKIASGGFGLDSNQDGITGDNFVFGNEATDKFFRIFGDADGDRDVDKADFSLFRGAYGKSQGRAGYDPSFDFNSNNIVDVNDFVQFRSRYTKTMLF